MSIDQAVINRIWCETLLEELVRFGVQDVCVAPGSRSTPLTLEAQAHPQLRLHTHFDERGLGFLALGLAKASDQPVAVIVTSGTAVANLLPAIAESGLTGEKLVLLTADRPQELVGCGANQAIEQPGIYSSHVTAALNLPSPTLNTSLNWLLSSVDQVMHQQAGSEGAVHINCPFPEPLYSQGDKRDYQAYCASVSSWRVSQQPYTQQHRYLPESVAVSDLPQRKGVVVVGKLTAAQAEKAAQFAHQLGWPILCDPQSGISSAWAHYDLWLQNEKFAAKISECDTIVQFGARIVSKRLNHWIRHQVTNTTCSYLYVSPSAQRNNQDHLPQQQFVCQIDDWIDTQLAQCHPLNAAHAGWADELHSTSEALSSLAQLHLSGEHSLSEIALALDIAERSRFRQLFLGNSLFVRLVDMFATLDGRQVWTNRGASGIDGLVATAAGVQRATRSPQLMFIGDTSLLYDLNSLALLTHNPTPQVMVVTNNDGGAIFDLLPVPAAQKRELYQMPHGYQFEFAAKQFGLNYHRAQTLADYRQAVEQHFASGEGTLLIEVQTPPDQASAQLKQFVQQVHAL